MNYFYLIFFIVIALEEVICDDNCILTYASPTNPICKCARGCACQYGQTVDSNFIVLKGEECPAKNDGKIECTNIITLIKTGDSVNPCSEGTKTNILCDYGMVIDGGDKCKCDDDFIDDGNTKTCKCNRKNGCDCGSNFKVADSGKCPSYDYSCGVVSLIRGGIQCECSNGCFCDYKHYKVGKNGECVSNENVVCSSSYTLLDYEKHQPCIGKYSSDTSTGYDYRVKCNSGVGNGCVCVNGIKVNNDKYCPYQVEDVMNCNDNVYLISDNNGNEPECPCNNDYNKCICQRPNGCKCFKGVYIPEGGKCPKITKDGTLESVDNEVMLLDTSDHLCPKSEGCKCIKDLHSFSYSVTQGHSCTDNTCSSDSVFYNLLKSDEVCKCPTSSSGRCKCMTFDNSQCNCGTGKVDNGSECPYTKNEKVVCPANVYLSNSQLCPCKTDELNKCICTNGLCQCVTGVSIFKGGSCPSISGKDVGCSENSLIGIDSESDFKCNCDKGCLCMDDDGEYFISNGMKCKNEECGENKKYTLLSPHTKCACSEQTRNKDNCICDNGMIYDPKTNECVCDEKNGFSDYDCTCSSNPEAVNDYCDYGDQDYFAYKGSKAPSKFDYGFSDNSNIMVIKNTEKLCPADECYCLIDNFLFSYTIYKGNKCPSNNICTGRINLNGNTPCPCSDKSKCNCNRNYGETCDCGNGISVNSPSLCPTENEECNNDVYLMNEDAICPCKDYSRYYCKCNSGTTCKCNDIYKIINNDNCINNEKICYNTYYINDLYEECICSDETSDHCVCNNKFGCASEHGLINYGDKFPYTRGGLICENNIMIIGECNCKDKSKCTCADWMKQGSDKSCKCDESKGFNDVSGNCQCIKKEGCTCSDGVSVSEGNSCPILSYCFNSVIVENDKQCPCVDKSKCECKNGYIPNKDNICKKCDLDYGCECNNGIYHVEEGGVCPVGGVCSNIIYISPEANCPCSEKKLCKCMIGYKYIEEEDRCVFTGKGDSSSSISIMLLIEILLMFLMI